MGARKADFVVPPGRLWPATPSGAPVEIEVFGATGEYKSGKTILGLSIAPGSHPPGHPFAGKPRTLYLDFEKSGGTYGGTGCQRVDVPARMIETHPRSYGPLDVFTWFVASIDKLAAGQFDVLIADPITDIESGLVEFVRKNCGQFGLTIGQVEKGGGLLWGAVKDYWKQVLLRLSAKVRCFYFTSHLRDEWKGNSPTGRREPKGKESLMELASLYLWLERKADDKGAVPDAPAAIVLKQRLADTSIDADTGELRIVPLMPPRIPVATVQAIRGYIASPPDYGKLKVGERVVEQPATEEELLRLRVAAAEAERDTEQTRLAQLARRAELTAMQQQAMHAIVPATDKTAATQAAKADAKKQEAAAAKDAEVERARLEAEGRLAAQHEEEKRLLQNADPAAALNPTAQRIQAEGAAAQHQGATSGTEPATDPGDDGRSPNLCTRSQAMEIERLFNVLGTTAEKRVMVLSRVGAKAVDGLTRQHAHLLIEKLLAAEAKKSQGE